EAFVERVWEWREHYGGAIVEQFKRLGASCDYSQERFTLDEGYARAVAEVFVRLYEKGWIYRDRYIVNWDPGTRSAISDLEVEERRDRHALLDPLRPGRWRLGNDRDCSSRDDARRYSRGCSSRGRALSRARRTPRDPAAGRTPSAGDRRRLREDGFRHRPAQAHAGARSQRFRDRCPSRARPGVGDRRGRAHDRRGGGALRGAHRDGGTRGRGGRAGARRQDPRARGVRA